MRKSLATTRVDTDFHGWLLQQAKLLKSKQAHLLHWEELAEELEEMGRRERDRLTSGLEVLLHHMLKLAYEGRETEMARRERTWKLSLVEHRNRVNDTLEGSSSLEAQFEELKEKAYRRARRLAGIDIDADQRPIGPLNCPWSKAQILDDDFFPDPVSHRFDTR